MSENKSAIDKIAEQVIFEALIDEIQRDEMPQIPSDKVEELKQHFDSMGVLVTDEYIDPGELNPIQEDYEEDKVNGIISEIQEEEEVSPVLVSEDYYILDGHHRTLAVQKINEDGGNVKLPIIRVHQGRDDALQTCMDFEKRMDEESDMEHVVVMAGRFHPFHKGHYQDYQKLESRFGTNNVYVITSNRTEPPKAPFTFEEKKRMMTKLYSIPASQIVEVENAYNPEEVLEGHDPDNTAFVMAMNGDDVESVNESEIGEYFAPYDPSDLQGYEESGYFYEIEHEPLTVKENDVPDKNVRKVFADSDVSERTKKAFFKEVFGTFNEDLFELVNQKFSEGPLNVELVEAFVEGRNDNMLQEYSKTAFVDADDGPTTWWEGMDERADAHEELARQMGLQIMEYLGDQNNFDFKRDGLGFPSFYPSGRSQEEDWNFSDPEDLYREFSGMVATAAGFQAMDWLGLDHADDVVRQEEYEDLVDKFFTDNMQGNDGPLADILDRLRQNDDVIVESRTDRKKVMAEGGGAFDNTVDVPADKTPQIFDEFIQHLEQVPEVTTEKVAGLGSTRQILQDLPGKKPKSGDVDLLTVTNNVPTSEATSALENHFNKVGMENKSFFGNIFSVAFETEHHEAPVQIDLMLAEPDEDDKTYRYLRDLKFWSGEEWDPDRDFLLKGLHRTELIRRITKAIGLSMARGGFAVYKWNPSHDSYGSLMQRLENKLSRTRKKSNKEDLRRLIEYLEQFDSMRGVKRAFFDENGFLEEKFLANRLRAGPVLGKYAAKVIEKELTEKRSLAEHDWEKVFQQFLGAGPNVKDRLKTFQGVLDFIREQYDEPDGLSQDRIEDAFRVYKQAMENDGYWSEGLRDMILDTLPFLESTI